MNSPNNCRALFRGWSWMIGSAVMLWFAVQGCSSVLPMKEPNAERFTRIVKSTTLQNSFVHNEIVPGMPYFVVSEIFADWKDKKKMLVPSVGSSQRVIETEGWGRDFNNPYIQIYLDEYDTEQGTLKIWYQLPSFYRMNISTNDTFYLYQQNGVVMSNVECLLNESTLVLREPLGEMSISDTMYAEIRYAEKPSLRDTTVTYWYLVEVLDDSMKISLQPYSFDFYPIERMELDGNRIVAFNWRK